MVRSVACERRLPPPCAAQGHCAGRHAASASCVCAVVTLCRTILTILPVVKAKPTRRGQGAQGAWTRGPTPAGCFQRTTGAQLSVYWQHGRCVHRLAQTRARKDSALSGAFAVSHVVVTRVLSVSVTVVMSRPGQQMTQSQALDGRGTTPRSNARLHLLVRRACAHVVSRTCCW